MEINKIKIKKKVEGFKNLTQDEEVYFSHLTNADKEKLLMLIGDRPEAEIKTDEHNNVIGVDEVKFRRKNLM